MNEEKHPGGRPPLFETPEELENIIEEYFASCIPEFEKDAEGNVLTTSKGYPIVKHNPYTLTGLALAIGFVSRQSIYDYEERNDQFSYIIKKARLRCENWVEKALLSGTIAPAAGIFPLKNYGWKDVQEHQMTGKDGNDLTVKIQDERRIKEEYGELLNDQDKFIENE